MAESKSAMETKKLLAYLVEKIEIFKNDLDLYREGKEVEVINPEEIMMKFFGKNFKNIKNFKLNKDDDNGLGGMPKFPS